MKAVVHVCRTRVALALALCALIGVTGFDGARAQDGPMRWNGVLEHLTAPVNGGAYPNGAARLSRHPVSFDGRWVVFAADVPNDPYPPYSQNFRLDRSTGNIEPIVGAITPNHPPVISMNGRHFSWESCDPWWRNDYQSICDVWVMDFMTLMPVNASATLDGTLSDGPSDEPVLSFNGRYLVFRTHSTTLLPAGAAPGQLVLRDRDTDHNGYYDEAGSVSLEVVSVSSTGEPGNAESASPEVSADGRFIAFRSLASNLVPDDTNNAWDVFLHDRQTGETRRINVGPNGQQATPTADSPAISMSPSGDLIAFAADDGYLTDPPTHAEDTNNALDVIVYDRQTNALTRIDIGTNGEVGNGHSYWPTFSETGQYISLLSTATNVDVPVTPGRAHVYVYDRFNDQATRVSLTPDGVEPDNHSANPVIAGDGSYVLFTSAATNLTTGPPPPPDAIYGAAHFNVTPDTVAIPSGGGEATVTITAQAYVRWSSYFTSQWLWWNTPPDGMGSGSATMVAEANPDPTPRSETITLLGKSVVVTQEAGLSATSLTPSSGPMTGGTLVTITGTGFEPDMHVYFGGGDEVPAAFVDSTTIRAITPPHAPGLVSVFVRTADFRWADLYDAFRYVDTTPPEITPYVSGTLSNGWYTSDVRVDWLLHDPDSAITQWCMPNDLTTDTSGTTFTCTASSDGGTASATSPTIRRDTTPPTVTITSPTLTVYDLNSAVTSAFTCSDTRSGVATCGVDAPPGSPVDTSTPGWQWMTASASDVAGNLGGSMVEYAVSTGSCAYPIPDIRGWWRFEGNTGNTRGSGGATFPATRVGLTADVYAAGRVGQGYQFEGANGYLQTGFALTLNNTHKFAMVAWVKPSANTYGTILRKKDQYSLARTPAGNVAWAFRKYYSSALNYVDTGVNLPLHVWSHVVVALDVDTVKTYVNGRLAHTAPFVDVDDSDVRYDGVTIGGAEDRPDYFKGVLDEVQILQYGATASHVESMFLSGGAGVCVPKATSFHFTSPIHAYFGGTTYAIDVVLRDEAGEPVVGKVVDLWSITGAHPLSTSTAYLTTDANGAVHWDAPLKNAPRGLHEDTFSVTFVGDIDYVRTAAQSDVMVNQGTPVITWPTPTPITYGTTLSNTQLNATASTAGTFTYSPPWGTGLPAGIQTLTATFTPNNTFNYTNATATVQLTVNQAIPTVAVTGGAFTFDGNPHAATGAVKSPSGFTIATPTFTYNGSEAAPVSAGSYDVLASFAGNANYQAASATATLTIGRATPTVNLTGGTFTFDGAAHAASATVTGMGEASLSPATITYNGSSSVPVNAGTYTVVASFAGEANYTEASATTTLTIEKATPVVSTTAGTFIYDETPHGATGSVTGVGGASLGPLTFTYNGSSDVPVNAGTYAVVASFAGDANYSSATAETTLTIAKATATVSATGGTFTYNGAPHPATGSVTGVGGASLGSPTFTYNGSSDVPVNAGTYAVVASFAGNANYEAASANATVTIGKAAAVLQWAPPAAMVYGTALGGAQLNATANVPGAFAYSPAAGTVLAAGAGRPLSAIFTPANPANYTGGSVATTVDVVPAPLMIQANNASKVFGAPLPSFTATPSGFVNGDSLASLSGTLSLSTTATAQSAVGAYPIVPSGLSSPNYAIALVNGTLTIVRGAVVVNVNTTPEPSGNNQPMTFTATVVAAPPAAGSPAGTVRFFDGATLLGTAMLNVGVASLTTAGLDVGTRSIEARYDGDPSFDPGTITTSHVIRSASQTPVLSVTSSRNPASSGQSVTLTANVSMSGGVAGSVAFYSGGTLLATRTISGGQATWTTTTLAVGSHAVTARYLGNGTIPPSRSNVFVQTVGASGWKNRTTTLALLSSSNPSTLGTAVTLTANVTGSSSSMPTGRVLFLLDGQVIGDPAGVVIAPVSGTTARATLTLPADLAHGRRNITATYRADANYKGSTAAITQTVN